MSNDWKYISGDYNIICDVCGVKIKASKSKKRWDGAIVCPYDYEERHIQDFIRVRPDKITVPFIRNPEDTFITGTCSIPSRHPYADYGTADCMEAGYALYTPAELAVAFPII
jgi:hypothetical protein